MIELTRLNNHRLDLNPDLIKYAEAIPDTTITLVTGEKLLVQDTLEALTQSIATWRANILAKAWPTAAEALSAAAISLKE